MIFRRKGKRMAESEMEWMRLLYMSQLNTLSLANMTLRIIEDPECVGYDSRDSLLEMIRELEYSVAHFEEYIV